MGEVRRVLRWYESAGDALIGEVELQNADLAVLRRLVGAPPDDPLYDCWPVAPDRLAELAAFAALPGGLERFACFIEAEA